jgi:hypothetical protein
MGSSEYGAMLSVANVTTGSSGTVNEANKSVDTTRPSRCSDLQGSRAPLNPYQLSLPAATLPQTVLSSDIHKSPRQKTCFDGNGLLRRERRWRGRLVRTSHYSFRQHLTKHSSAAVSLSARLCHTNAAGLKAPPYLSSITKPNGQPLRETVKRSLRWAGPYSGLCTAASPKNHRSRPDTTQGEPRSNSRRNGTLVRRPTSSSCSRS